MSSKNLASGYFGNAMLAAAWAGSVSCLEALLSAGADVDHLAKAGSEAKYRSPLVAVAALKHVTCGNLLIQRGADVGLVLKHGR